MTLRCAEPWRSGARPPFLAASGCVALVAVLCKGLDYWQEAFAPPPGARRKRAAAPYGRIGGRPIIPNPEAEKFPAGVPRDEDGFPVITLREQYETNVTMYVEGLGPFPGPPPDFSGDWDYIPPDPEDEDFDPDAPLPPVPPDPQIQACRFTQRGRPSSRSG